MGMILASALLYTALHTPREMPFLAGHILYLYRVAH